MSNSIIEVKNLVKEFSKASEKLRIIDNLNFNLEYNQKVVITGESGSGKSTLIQILSGLDNFTSGEVFFDGVNFAKSDESFLTKFRAKNIGLIFQFHYLLNDWSALENVLLPAYMCGESYEKAKERALSLLDSVNLTNRASHFPSELSGGERQRVAVARALINNPKVIFADEPTGNLDYKNSKIVEEILFNLVEKENKSLILVTHNRNLIKRADVSHIMADGILK